MLEALAQVEWTGAKRRRELCPAQTPIKKNADFAAAFDLPIDCAKVIEIDDQEYFEVEPRLLYTGAASCRTCGGCPPQRHDAHRRGRFRRPFQRCKRRVRLLYVSNGRRFAGQTVITGGSVRRKEPSSPVEDFPDYLELNLEPNFYLYRENLLSARYALRLTDKPDLSVLYFNKAQAAGGAAEVTSIAHSAARVKAPDSRQEELGLS
jgi:hypothetical protein